MLEKMGEQVKEFTTEILGIDEPRYAIELPRAYALARADFNEEEITELREAIHEGDIAKQIDAHVDNIYVSMGTLVQMGVLPELHFDEVHRANMAKKRGEGKRGLQGWDALKPEGWKGPDHESIIEDMRLRMQVSPVLVEATRIRIERSAKYNHGGITLHDHFPLGLPAYVHMVFDKAMRAVSCVLRGVDWLDETLVDCLHDGINYATFALERIEIIREERKTKEAA